MSQLNNRRRSSYQQVEQTININTMKNDGDTSLKVEEEEVKVNLSWKDQAPLFLKLFTAELIGTAFLMFLGCMACVQSMDVNNKATDFHSAVTFGFTVASVIAIIGHISSAHLNPAVTVALYILGHISAPMVLVYLIAEIIGATLGVGLLTYVTPSFYLDGGLCVTKPQQDMDAFQALAVEFIITSFLIFLICGLTDPLQAERQDSAPLKFAALIIAVSLAAGKYTGASMNPARSIGPAIWTGVWTDHWVYWVSPITASILVPLFYKKCFLKKGSVSQA